MLAAGVAHDFNNLLTVISGNTQLALARLQPNAPIKQRLVEIDKAAARRRVQAEVPGRR
jgi:signal transduction histidine kinase